VIWFLRFVLALFTEVWTSDFFFFHDGTTGALQSTDGEVLMTFNDPARPGDIMSVALLAKAAGLSLDGKLCVSGGPCLRADSKCGQ
jgi:hypothetical protein